MTIPCERSRYLAGVDSVRHGFFGRNGGHSSGDFTSLNMSLSVGDDPERVARNRADAVSALGLPADALALVRQTHSAIVHTLAAPTDAADRPEGDAMVTNRPGVLLGILTADCTPVLLADVEAGVIGAFHAGWRGAAAGIAANTVAAMTALGADPGRMIAVIGPTISQANYEVGPDFAAAILERYPDAGHRFVTPAGGRPHFDLPGFVADGLRGAGVRLVEDLRLCTYAAPARWFSHRHATHNATATGRQIALIGLV